MRRIILGLLAGLLAPAAALAQPQPPQAQPPQVLWSQDGTWTGSQVFQSTHLPNVSIGTVGNPVVLADPPVETYMNQVANKVILTKGNGGQDILGFISHMYIDPGIYNWTKAGHTSAGYFYGHGYNTLALANCVPGVNCPGNIENIVGLVAGADNSSGTGAAQNAYPFVIHGPTTPVTGGTLDRWSAMYVQGAIAGWEASVTHAFITDNDMPAGFGTTTPQAMVHARVINSDGTAQGNIVNSVLTLTSKPTNPYGITPSCGVSGAGIAANTFINGYTAAAGAGLMYTLSPAGQNVAQGTYTFTCRPYPMLIQANGGNADLGFIAANGGNTPNNIISARFDVNSAHIHFQPGGATAIVVGKNASGARMGIGNLDTYPNFTIDAAGVAASWGALSQGPRFSSDGGCGETGRAGGATAGRFTVGVSTSCTVIVTMAGGAAQNAAVNEWGHCGINNRTHPGAANAFALTAATLTTATFTGTPVTGDTLDFACTGF